MYKSIRNQGYPFFPRVIPIARFFFSHMSYCGGEVSWRKCYQNQEDLQRTPKDPSHNLVPQWLLAFKTLFSKITKYKYYKEMGKKTYLGMTIHKLGLAKFQKLCFRLID